METLSKEDIAHLGRLARLALNEEETARFAGQLSSVVGYVAQLKEVAAPKSGRYRGVTGLHNALAADLPRGEDDPATIRREAVLAAAPLSDGDFFTVRAVMGDETGSA